MGEENKNKIEELTKEFEGSKAYVLDGASEDELVKEVFTKIKEENGKIDGIVNTIENAYTQNMHNYCIYPSINGNLHISKSPRYVCMIFTFYNQYIQIQEQLYHSILILLFYQILPTCHLE